MMYFVTFCDELNYELEWVDFDVINTHKHDYQLEYFFFICYLTSVLVVHYTNYKCKVKCLLRCGEMKRYICDSLC